MAAGAEGEPRIQPQGDTARYAGLLPLGNDQQPFADLHGLIEGLPVVFPVGVGHVLHGQQQRRVLRVLLFQRAHGDAHVGHGVHALGAVLHVERHPAHALFLLEQILVHVVPVFAVVLQKVLKIPLVVDDHAGDALVLQQLRHGLDAPGRGVDAQLQPIHIAPPSVISL